MIKRLDSKCNLSIPFIVVISVFLVIGVNLISFSFKNADAQNSDGFKVRQIQHMRGHGPHMMGPGMHQMQSPNSFSTIIANNTMDEKNSIFVSIVLGATSLATNAYQPNPVYVKEGQTIVWTNKDNNIHTVTQKAYSSFASDDDNTFTRFDSGILNMGQSFFQTFNKKGIYDYYCTIHPWMAGQVTVSANSSSVNNNTNTNAITTATDTINNKNKS